MPIKRKSDKLCTLNPMIQCDSGSLSLEGGLTEGFLFSMPDSYNNGKRKGVKEIHLRGVVILTSLLLKFCLYLFIFNLLLLLLLLCLLLLLIFIISSQGLISILHKSTK